MDNRDSTPYAPQDAQAVSEMLAAMNASSGGQGRRSNGKYKKKMYSVSNGNGKTVNSWQLNEWDYKKRDLPTYARGLFTHTNNGKPEIAVRGYDKFFNVGEVHHTQWTHIEKNTRGPYELSVKENGCIIFIAGLDDKTLLVTSKHSTGPRQDDSANHAFAGERWIDKQLTSLGRTRADLAKRLRSMNATAVAELCDDEFEEHVLEYTPDQAGLYLHGININLPEFATYPGNQVAKFAEEWGFRKVIYEMEEDIQKVKSFLDEVAETGNYKGRDTEGFVIRCQMRETPQHPWHDWFFKYKFEEPYLMYRQWREATKAVIAGKQPRYKKHKQITEEYLHYARRQLVKNPQLGKEYNNNHGIIAMREGFLKEKGVKGSDIIRSEMEASAGGSDEPVTKEVVLVPIATIGCGKTTVATALVKLFHWGHIQNDNITGKKNRPQQFTIAITNSIAVYPVVVADRNNHQRRERHQILDDLRAVIPNAQFVALHWVHDRSNYGEIRKAMQERIFSRGDNHQTIQAGSKSNDEIVGIMDGFMKRFEPLDTSREPDDAFDTVIDLDVTASSRENLETVVQRLHEAYPKLLQLPTEEEMDEAIRYALTDYKPDIKHELGFKDKSNSKSKEQAPRRDHNGISGQGSSTKQAKAPKVEYFRIALPAARVASILDSVFSSDQSADTTRFYKQLKGTRRLQPEFHVTLIHRNSISDHPDYWYKLNDLWHQKFDEQKAKDANLVAIPGSSPNVSLDTVQVQLERVVWDKRVMAIVARLVDGEAKGFKTVNDMAHVTVGTAASDIKPKESNDLLKRWVQGDQRVDELKVRGNVVLDGTVNAMMSR